MSHRLLTLGTDGSHQDGGGATVLRTSESGLLWRGDTDFNAGDWTFNDATAEMIAGGDGDFYFHHENNAFTHLARLDAVAALATPFWSVEMKPNVIGSQSRYDDVAAAVHISEALPNPLLVRADLNTTVVASYNFQLGELRAGWGGWDSQALHASHRIGNDNWTRFTIAANAKAVVGYHNSPVGGATGDGPYQLAITALNAAVGKVGFTIRSGSLVDYAVCLLYFRKAFAAVGRYVTVTGLSASMEARLRNGAGGTLASAVEAGGTASLDCLTVAPDQVADVAVYDSGGTLLATSTGEVWPGEVWAFAQV